MYPYLCILLLLLSSVFSQGQELDRYMAERKLVDVSSRDTTLRVELAYATAENFLGQAVYSGITRAWLHPDAETNYLPPTDC